MRVRFVSRLAMRNMGRANDWNALIAIASLRAHRSLARSARRRLPSISRLLAGKDVLPATTVNVPSVATWHSKTAGAATHPPVSKCPNKEISDFGFRISDFASQN
jgi:hypothetical protein